MSEINIEDASIKNLNIVSLSNKGLVELSGEEALFKPVFYKKGEKLEIIKSESVEELYYIPSIKLHFLNGSWALIKVYADIKEKSFIYEFEGSEEIEVRLKRYYYGFMDYDHHPNTPSGLGLTKTQERLKVG